MDNTAKRCCVLNSFPLNALAGSRHHPVLGSINHRWNRVQMPMPKNATYMQRIRCTDAYHADSSTWQSFHQNMSNLLEEQSNLPDDTSLMKMHTQALDLFKQHFDTPSTRSAPWELTCQKTQEKWTLLKLIKQEHRTDLSSLFRTWARITAFRKACHQHKRACQEVRKARIDAMLMQAREAADVHNSHKLYRLIRTLSPKTKNRKMQLRSETGLLMNPYEEFCCLCQHVRTTWHGISHTSNPKWAPGVPFDVDTLTKAIRSIPFTKATAPRSAPAPCWIVAPEQIAEKLWFSLQAWWSQLPIYIPQSWRDATLFLMPKPGKPSTRPNQLRPLALQDPLGKAVLGIVAKIARDQCLHQLCRRPQFAYLPKRGVLDAISRVVNHCRLVRKLIQEFSVTKNRTPNRPVPLIFGGVQISLDLSQAFDSLPRPTLFDSLYQLDIQDCLRTIMEQWHLNTRYHVHHKGYKDDIPTTTGIRQGCQAAPLLWAFFAHDLLEHFCRVITDPWVQEHVTIFADDIHAGATFCSPQELQHTLIAFGQLLDVIEQKGLRLNVQKSCALLIIKGRHCTRQYHAFTRCTREGHCLVIPRRGGKETLFRIHTQTQYLGIILTYTSWEDRTLTHRIHSARVAFHRLKQWLQSKSRLTLKQKLLVWKSTVISTLMFGLFTVGITPTGIARITSIYMKQLRCIHQASCYMHRISHQDFLIQFQQEPPLVYLWKRGLAELAGIRARNTITSEHDVTQPLRLSTLDEALDLVQLSLTGPITTDVMEQPLTCDRCSEIFPSLKSLHAHQAKAHAMPKLSAHHTFKISRDSHDGFSTCSHCRKTMVNFEELKRHIIHARCPLFDPTKADDATMQDKRRALDQYQELCDHMRLHCLLCGKSCPQIREHTRHARLDHREIATTALDRHRAWTAQYTDSPCPLCQTAFRQTHSCPVRLQVALHLENQGDTHIDQVPLNIKPEVCHHCAKPFGTLLALQQHVQASHRTYSCVRDSQGGTAVCAHCGVDCKEHWHLRAHIDKHRCSNFNVHRQDQNALLLDRRLHLHLLQGDIQTILSAPEDAFHLTQVCLLCMQQFRRSMDLQRHLQQNHGEHFRQADSYHALLLEVTQTHGCVCNPSPWQTVAQAHRHQCMAYRQLAILHHHLNPDHRWIIFPNAFNEEHLTRVTTWNPLLHSKAPDLVQRLLRQELHELWSSPTMCQALKEHCSICTHQSTDLVTHLINSHKAFLHEFPGVFRYLALNLKRLGPPDQCCACHHRGNAYQLDDDTPWKMLQHQCPVLINCGLLLCRTLLHLRRQQGEHGRSGTDRGRPSQSVRDLLRRHATKQQRAEQGTTTGGLAVPKTPETHTGDRERSPRRSDGPDHPHAGSADDQARRQPEQLSKSRQLHHPLQPHSKWPDRPHGPGGEHVEREDEIECTGSSTPQGAFGDGTLSSDGHSLQRVRQSNTGSQDQARSFVDLSAAGEQRIPISQMGYPPKDDSPGKQARHPPERDGIPSSPTAGADQAKSERDPLPLPAEHGQDDGCCSMASSGLDEGPSTEDLAGQTGRELDLAAGGCKSAPTHPTTQPDSTGTSGPFEELQSSMIRTMMSQWLQTTGFLNEGVMCYVNSSMACTLWAITQQSNFAREHLGPNYTAILKLLQGQHPLSLTTRPELRPLFDEWGDTHRPQDAAEFTTALLSWLQAPGITHEWQRAFSATDGFHVEDGECNAYNVLCIDVLSELDAEKLTLESLLPTWHEALHMKAALVDDSRVLILHVMRTYPLIRGLSIGTQLTWSTRIQIPFFEADYTRRWESYEVIAFGCYSGSGTNGHWNCVLRNGTDWILRDDNRMPKRMTSIPFHLTETATTFWLIRTDECLSHPPLWTPRFDPRDNLAIQAMCKVLQDRSNPGLSDSELLPSQPSALTSPDEEDFELPEDDNDTSQQLDCPQTSGLTERQQEALARILDRVAKG